MDPQERAKSVFDKAEELGLGGPTEAMVQEAIHDAEFNALMYPEFTAAQHDIPWPITKIVQESNMTVTQKIREHAEFHQYSEKDMDRVELCENGSAYIGITEIAPAGTFTAEEQAAFDALA